MIPNRLATYTLSALFCLAAGSSATAQNLVVNPAFTAGNTDFSSDYAYYSGSSIGHDKYSIIPNPREANSTFGVAGDHTTGTGLMMVVDGSTTAGVPFWRETVSVTASTAYTFSTWALKMENQTPPVLYFTINGVQQGNSFPLPADPAPWQNFAVSWNSGTATSAVLELRLSTVGTTGNNLAVDDLSFVQATVPEPTSALLFTASGLFLLSRRRKDRNLA